MSTWVLCDPETQPIYSLLGDAIEVRWGPLVLTLGKAVLPELIRQGRVAQAELARRLAESTDYDTESATDEDAGQLGATA